VRLESDWEYQLALNGGGRNDFQSAAGVPLDPMFWTFQTRKTPGAADAATTQTRTLGVAVDPRVELLSIIFRLAGNQEYNRGAVASYNEDVDRWFGGRKNHPPSSSPESCARTTISATARRCSWRSGCPSRWATSWAAVPWQIDTRGMDPQWPARELGRVLRAGAPLRAAHALRQVLRRPRRVVRHGGDARAPRDHARRAAGLVRQIFRGRGPAPISAS
jgi:hypothetical protein